VDKCGWSSNFFMTMNNTTKAIILGGSLVAASAASAEVEVDVHAGYHSIYEFRGVDLGNNLFTAGVNLSTEVAEDLTLSGGVWYGATEGNDSSFDEIDLFFNLTKSFERFDLSVGYTHYGFAGDASQSNTSEWSIGASTNLGYGVGFSTTLYQDLDFFEGSYIESVFSRSFVLSECVGLDLAAGISYSNGYNLDTNGGTVNGLNSYYISATAPWEVGKGFTVAPYIKYVVADSDLASGEEGDSENLLFGGVSVSYAF